MAEGNWNQPDPSGPAWASQTDYYMGSYAGYKRQQQSQPVTQPKPRPKAPPSRLMRVIRAIILAVLALWLTMGTIGYAVMGKYAYLPLAIVAVIFALLARRELRQARRIRAEKAGDDSNSPSKLVVQDKDEFMARHT